ncbi:MAG: heme lyase CcmF/NrfE family subunit [Candidatus Schekmanbacteria bacterium]|nr:heme lyase CcmF/NrfE family subunit [Candidatus Schekmanbacteria bacterium]
MVSIGEFSIHLAFFLAAYGAVAAIVGVVLKEERFVKSAEYTGYALLLLLTVTSAALIHAFVTRNFEIQYVYHYSDKALDMFYTVSAFWAGQEGSILLWAWLLALFTVITVAQNRHKHQEMMPYIISVLMITMIFFLTIMTFVTPPFATFHFKPEDGAGLNPLLQNLGMIWHPPTLYLGYVGFTIPFAFALAALISGQLDDAWIRSTRRWTLFAWLFLTAGIVLGGQWAYVELGWGGYWAWDPVENASFMPWLTGTAYLHSVMLQEKKDMLKIWNMVLIILTFTLCIFGTFITRSGIIGSVHSFGESSLGPFFITYLVIALSVSFGLLIQRRKELESSNELDSLLSRESTFLYNNLILVAMCLVVFIGTCWPFISEAARGTKATVTAAYFDKINVPIGLALLALMGICPLISWRRASVSNLKRNFIIPTAISLLGLAGLIGYGLRGFYPLMSLTFCIFVAVAITMEFVRGTTARRKITRENYLLAFWRLIGKNKRRYGGYVVHIGVVLTFLGITGSSAYKVEKEVTVSPGESFTIGDYTLKYEKYSSYPTQSKIVTAAILPVFKDGKKIDILTPEKNLHFKSSEQPVTEVSIHWNWCEDLYIILAGFMGDGLATFKVYINPMVVWLWVGGIVMAIGSVIAIWPDKKKRQG